MEPPTMAQQRAVAFLHIPFAVISIFSSCYVIHHLLCREREKLGRMYHRIVLSMNVAITILSICWIWRPFAVPEGTPGYVGASGTIQTCTASGFLFTMFIIAVPIYYSSISVQALTALRHNFQEAKYRWIEKWIHGCAWVISISVVSVLAATENINPGGGGCYMGKYPPSCETDPNVPCQRGKDIGSFEMIVGLILMFIYLFFTPSVLVAIYCWIGKARKAEEEYVGMQRIREAAKGQMMKSVAVQISVYLSTFLMTWIFGFAYQVIRLLTGQILYNLLIFAHCMLASQGFCFAMVYFYLNRLGKTSSSVTPLCPCTTANKPPERSRNTTSTLELTVGDIRTNVERKISREGGSEEDVGESTESCVFNIFDGTAPDPSSPWARYIDASCRSGELENGQEGEVSAAIVEAC